MGSHGKSLAGVDEKILQGGDFRLLAAHAQLRASGTLGGLFTLKAKHGCLLAVWVGFFARDEGGEPTRRIRIRPSVAQIP